MRRWLWLLAVPYLVFHCIGHSNCWEVTKDGFEDSFPMKFKEQEIADDMAEALNEAHERREIRRHILAGDRYDTSASSGTCADFGSEGCKP